LDSRWNFKTARNELAGAGTQTAALAFGGNPPPAYYTIQKNIMDQLGQVVEI
jgi:hypothetical protein